MSPMRQDTYDDELFSDKRLPIRGLSVRLPDGHRLLGHSHPWAQLIYADHGSMQVSTPKGTWLIAPTRAIWVPPGAIHEIVMRGVVDMRTLYAAPGVAAPLAQDCCVLEVIPLLRELVLHIVAIGSLTSDSTQHEHLKLLLVDQIAAARSHSTALRLPQDPRALRLAERIVADPGSTRSLGQLAASVGASLRTLQRLFLAETTITLDAWRTRARLQHALVQLSRGNPVTQVAFGAGYNSSSAFISAFRREFGLTPGVVRSRSINAGALKANKVNPKPDAGLPAS
jgi:AraC-like DNA-binding protein